MLFYMPSGRLPCFLVGSFFFNHPQLRRSSQFPFDFVLNGQFSGHFVYHGGLLRILQDIPVESRREEEVETGVGGTEPFQVHRLSAAMRLAGQQWHLNVSSICPVVFCRGLRPHLSPPALCLQFRKLNVNEQRAVCCARRAGPRRGARYYRRTQMHSSLPGHAAARNPSSSFLHPHGTTRRRGNCQTLGKFIERQCNLPFLATRRSHHA